MKQLLLYLCCAIFMVACHDSSTQEDNTLPIDTNHPLTEKRAEATKEVLATIPLPPEAAAIFQNEGVVYDKSYLNPIDKIATYTTNIKKALNFGVYGVDLSYATIFDQTQESMRYLSVAQQLAEEMGLTNVFDNATIEQVERNIENKDSVLTIAEQSYKKADGFLKESQQDDLAALVLVGSWVEGLYLGTRQSGEDIEKSTIRKKINEQKPSLTALINLLSTFENSTIANLNNQLKQLDEIFLIENPSDFINIANKTAEIRNQIIN